MTDSLETTQESRLYESLTLEEKQDLYDRAARDYLDMLREMTADEARAYFKRMEYVDWQIAHPRPSTRCTKCGGFALERRYSSEHVSWQCLEETCREFWEWKKR